MEAAPPTVRRHRPSSRRRRAPDVRLERYGLIIAAAGPARLLRRSRTSSNDGNLVAPRQQPLRRASPTASIWALIALGYTLVYGIIELINFAHGDVFMIGSFVSAGFFGDARAHARPPARSALVVGLLVTLVVAMVACGALNVMIERVGLPAAAQRAQAGAADHRGRLLVHPPERRPAVARRLASRASPT